MFVFVDDIKYSFHYHPSPLFIQNEQFSIRKQDDTQKLKIHLRPLYISITQIYKSWKMLLRTEYFTADFLLLLICYKQVANF